MDVRIDERGRDDDATRRPRLDSCDDASFHGDPQGVVDPLGGSDHASLERQRVRAAVAHDQHHATSARSRASTGATVSTS